MSITEGASATIGFTHGPDHERVKQTAPEGTTYYLSGLGVAVEKVVGSRDFAALDAGDRRLDRGNLWHRLLRS